MRPILWLAALGVAVAGGGSAGAGGLARTQSPAPAAYHGLPAYDAGAIDALLRPPPAYDEDALQELLRPAPAYDPGAIDRLLQTDPLFLAPARVNFQTGEMVISHSGRSAIDRVRLTVSEARRSQRLGPRIINGSGDEAAVYDVAFQREWPSLVSAHAGRYGLDVSPHAGFSVAGGGRSAEAGAVVRLGADLQSDTRRRLARLGQSAVDGRSFRERGRVYLFAAASGQAVGWNLTRDPFGGWQGAGLSTDRVGALVTKAQAGVAWRQGPRQASISYISRRIRYEGPFPEIYRQHDSMIAFSVTARSEP